MSKELNSNCKGSGSGTPSWRLQNIANVGYIVVLKLTARLHNGVGGVSVSEECLVPAYLTYCEKTFSLRLLLFFQL